MASIAAYAGLRWGELIALTIPQVDAGARVIDVDRKGRRGGGAPVP
jgi:integrase